MTDPSIGVVFVTYRAKHHLPHCLPSILESPLKPRVLVMNSSSEDGTVELAQEMGAETLVIPRHKFNHGTSRERARKFLKTDIVVMMTPDAYAVDQNMLTHLVQPLIDGVASIAYARQIPHDQAGIFEQIPREFNYPDSSQIRSFDDRRKYGVYTIFCSNSCAAYKNDALDQIDGFGSVLIGEDTFTTAKLLQRGHKIAYVAEAVVKHSHTYTLWEEFRRNFDTGLVRSWNRDLLSGLGSDENRGKRFFTYMLKKLAREKPHLIPYGCLQTVVKYMGYRLGKWSGSTPTWFKRLCSGQDFYWKPNKQDV
ncbi:MAG: hypothetical protein K940chlam3_00654 [Chlamydiae bacterium]|nr:hypothetical protein [Chlamydiota bacterium]